MSELMVETGEAGIAMTAQEVADLDAEYALLLHKILDACGECTPTVAAAAAASAAGCIVVNSITNEDEGKKYLNTCFYDVLQRLPEAYLDVRKDLGDGTDTGKEG